MVFVGNPGCVQIHSGPVHRIEVMGPGLTCSTRASTCTCARTGSTGAWVVRKPSVNGEIHSLELFDAARRVFVQVFG